MTPHGLKLQRKEGQCIKIGDNITIHVVKTRSSRTELVIDAPKETRVLRGELTPKSLTPTPLAPHVNTTT